MTHEATQRNDAFFLPSGLGRCSLSERQVQVADLAAAGHCNKEISRRLDLSPAQVQEALKAVYRRAGVRTRWELMAQRRDAGPPDNFQTP